MEKFQSALIAKVCLTNEVLHLTSRNRFQSALIAKVCLTIKSKKSDLCCYFIVSIRFDREGLPHPVNSSLKDTQSLFQSALIAKVCLTHNLPDAIRSARSFQSALIAKVCLTGTDWWATAPIVTFQSALIAKVCLTGIGSGCC